MQTNLQFISAGFSPIEALNTPQKKVTAGIAPAATLIESKITRTKVITFLKKSNSEQKKYSILSTILRGLCIPTSNTIYPQKMPI